MSFTEMVNDDPTTVEVLMPNSDDTSPCDVEWFEFDRARRILEKALVDRAVAVLTSAHAGQTDEFDVWAAGKVWSEVIGEQSIRALIVRTCALYPSGTEAIFALKVETALRNALLLNRTRVQCDPPNGSRPATIRFS